MDEKKANHISTRHRFIICFSSSHDALKMADHFVKATTNIHDCYNTECNASCNQIKYGDLMSIDVNLVLETTIAHPEIVICGVIPFIGKLTKLFKIWVDRSRQQTVIHQHFYA